MAARFSGTFVISWSQVEIDGLPGARVGSVAIGSTWRWTGQASRIDDPGDVLVLGNADGDAITRRRAARHLRRILGGSGLLGTGSVSQESEEPIFKTGFEVTNGRQVFRAIFIDLGIGQNPLLLFRDALPDCDQDLWVVSSTLSLGVDDPRDAPADGTICFTPGTRIMTPNGPVEIQDLQEDDQVITKDNGPKTIRWIGTSHISGGRLIAMPHLRPVRVRAHVLGDGEPDADLVVSPDHRLVVKGPIAQTLFNSHEVLVTARDLINDYTITPDYRCRGVTYIHLMLDAHQVVWANGVEVESFHPAGTTAEKIETQQRYQLYDRFPDIRQDPYSYGEFARRNLSPSEAAILTYGALSGH